MRCECNVESFIGGDDSVGEVYDEGKWSIHGEEMIDLHWERGLEVMITFPFSVFPFFAVPCVPCAPRLQVSPGLYGYLNHFIVLDPDLSLTLYAMWHARPQGIFLCPLNTDTIQSLESSRPRSLKKHAESFLLGLILRAAETS